MAAGGEERVDERDGRDIGSAEGCGFNRGEKDLVAFAGKGGEIGVCDADAIGAVRLGLLRAFDGLAKAAAETDGNYQIFPTHAASEMQDAPSGSSGKNRQTENAHLIFEIVGQSGGKISRKDKNPARGIKALREGGQALGVEAVLEPLKIFDVLLDGVADLSLHSGRAGSRLHGIERGCEGDGEVVQVALEMPITGEAKTPDDADDRRRVGLKTLGNGADAEKDILAGMFEDRADDLLALGAQLVDAFREIRNHGCGAGVQPRHRARGFPKSHSLSTPGSS